MSTIEEALTAAIGLQQGGQIRDAQRIYAQIVAIDPTSFDAQHLLGVAEWQLGNLSEAIHHLRLAIELNPDFADAYYNLANAERDNGHAAEAIESYRRALRLRADFPAAYTNLGHLLMAQGSSAEAADCYRRVLELQPESAKAHHHLASALREQGFLAEAADSCRQALAHDPNLAEALNDLAVIHLDCGDFQKAIDLCRAAIQRKPAYAEAHYNLGAAHFEAGVAAEATASYQRAIELKPDLAKAYHNLGNAWLAMGDYDRAESSYRAALQLTPTDPGTHANLGTLLLLRGELSRGWEEYEWRWKTGVLPRAEFSQPRWTGNPLGTRTILLYAEQGIGDTFQFIRYVSLVKQQNPAAKVIVQCPQPLLVILRSCRDIDGLFAEGEGLPPFDCQAPLLSVPAIFQATLETIPASIPYLYADQNLIDAWREKLALVRCFRVGVNWQGYPAQRNFFSRNIPQEHFLALAQTPGVQLISLQKGEARGELDGEGERQQALDLGSDFDTVHGAFMDTAAVMMNLDLVITSDTSIAHLAGALGVPVWVALPFVPDWRWLLDRSDSPWYPTMRLFRQKLPGDWAGVFEEIRAALVERINGQVLMQTPSRSQRR